MKPSWNDAPEWAQWLAKDADEMWYWHEKQPYKSYERGEWKSAGRSKMIEDGIDWWNSCEARPE